jgi:hypothetical protein
MCCGQFQSIEIEQLPITTTDDIARVVDVLDKFDANIHRHRGAAIGSDGDSPISLEAFRAYQQDKKGSDPTSASRCPSPGKPPRRRS